MIPDRLRQFRHAGACPTDEDLALGRQWLTPALFDLFSAQHPRDVVHSANTARWLLTRGHTDPDLIAAALLHDLGKGHQRRLDRVAHVVASNLGVGRRLANPGSRFDLRRAIARSRAHGAAGAETLRELGAPIRVVDLTALHHEPAGEDRMLALLQQADAAS